MWKKDEQPNEAPSYQPERAPDRPAPSAPPVSAASASSELAVIGRSITLRGDVTGDEDLMIQGRVEGSVDLHQHSVTVGSDGEVIASITGRVVTIEGRVEGNVDGTEQVTLRSTAFVQGDITAPRVVLENGARFRGLVDMGDADERPKRSGTTSEETRRGTGRPDSSAASPGRRETGKTTSNAAAASREETDTQGSSSGGTSTSGSGKGRSPSEAEAGISI